MSNQKSSRNEKKSKYWGALSYLDSQPSNIFELAKKCNIECACILHDKDYNEMASPQLYTDITLEPGQAKKSHYHWIFAFPNTTTAKHATEVILSITNGLVPIALSNIKGAYAYFIHKYDPEKYQYDSSEIQMFNGFAPENYFSLDAGEEDAATIAIENIIDDKGFEEYSSLVQFLRINHPDLARFITRHTIHFNAYLRSIHEAKRQAKKDRYLELQIAYAELRLSEAGFIDTDSGEVF